jgi:S-methylmethionine-dependent homocysteine/selenocysteine methylase
MHQPDEEHQIMARYRDSLPQLSGDFFLTDAGIETDIIFNKGVEIREFAAHTLLPDESGREVLKDYFRGFLTLAREMDAGFQLDSQTWKAHMHWADDLKATEQELKKANQDAIAFISELREEFKDNAKPIVLNALIGPRGDAYAPEEEVAANEAEQYHCKQMSWLADTDVDMVSALTFTQSDEATGAVRAARKYGLPIMVSFTVETDGKLPMGQPLGEAIEAVDDATDSYTAYYMVNCAHPTHFAHVLDDESWTRRIRGLRCNASKMSHAELDEAPELDAGNLEELASQYMEFTEKMPWLNVFGGCCGSDLRHVAEIARKVRKG